MAQAGDRHSSGAMKFPNGWFIERTITRGGRQYRQWFRTRDPNATPAPRARRARAAAPAPAAATPTTPLRKFAKKVGLADSAKQALKKLPADLRKKAKEDLLAIRKGAEEKKAEKPKRASKAKKAAETGDDATRLTSANIEAEAAKFGVEVRGALHFNAVNEQLFGGKMTTGDLRKMTGAESFKKHFGDKAYNNGTKIVTLFAAAGASHATEMTFKGQFYKKAGHTAETARKFKVDPDGKPYVYHDHFFVSDKMQGGGMGKEVLKGQLATYKKLGLSHVSTYAVDVGRYYWRKIGYERDKGDFAEDKKALDRHIRDTMGLTQPIRKQILDQIKTSRQLATLVIDGKKVGKEFLTSYNGPSGDMTLNLKGAGWKHVQEEFGI